PGTKRGASALPPSAPLSPPLHRAVAPAGAAMADRACPTDPGHAEALAVHHRAGPPAARLRPLADLLLPLAPWRLVAAAASQGHHLPAAMLLPPGPPVRPRAACAAAPIAARAPPAAPGRREPAHRRASVPGPPPVHAALGSAPPAAPPSP